MALEAVIGLECHVQLRTRTKMFCGCRAAFGDEPNTAVCPVCLGLPGSLPRPNGAAVEAALRLGLALGCEVPAVSVFARKHYFYPDMPKNYQITQYDRPLCVGGALPAEVGGEERDFELARLHLEEDTGKSFHPERRGDRPVSRLDYNRAGVPLVEIVTKPVFRDPAECAAFLAALRRLVRWLGVSDGDMEKGQLRCDANVSLRPGGATALGVKTELKNLNTIHGVERGLRAEIGRQRALLEEGGEVEPATLLYDAGRGRLAVMRTKEEIHDYRYFPEPDLPALATGAAALERLRAALPELPWARAARLCAVHGLAAEDARVLCEQRELADYYEACAAGADPRTASHWVRTAVLAALRERGWTLEALAGRLAPARLAGLVARVAAGTLPGPLAKRAFAWMLEEPGGVDEVLARHGARVLDDLAALRALAREVLDEHAEVAAGVLAGRGRAVEFLLGQVVKRSGGQAAPGPARAALEAELARRAGRGGA